MPLKNHYFFTLGRNPSLSVIEIVRYMEINSMDYQIIEYNVGENPILILTTVGKLKVYSICDILAGSIKAGRLWLKTTPERVEDDLANSFFYVEDTKKIQFCLDLYGPNLDYETIYAYFRNQFKSMKQKAMLKDYTPSALANAMKRDYFMDIVGIESNVQPNTVYMGRTTSVSDINERKKRYERRPVVDEKIATSVRLARMLVNFAGIEKGSHVLDPFCGIGTVLGEVLMLGGIAHGLELDQGRVKDCKSNLQWILHEYKIEGSYDIKNGDATKIQEYFEPKSIDILVTEPELGPFLRKVPHSNKAEQIISNLRHLYKGFFKNAGTLLKDRAKLVVVLPEIPIKGGKSRKMNINNLISNTDIVMKRLTISKRSGINIPEIQNPVIYKEHWHKIIRNIYILEKKLKS